MQATGNPDSQLGSHLTWKGDRCVFKDGQITEAECQTKWEGEECLFQLLYQQCGGMNSENADGGGCLARAMLFSV